MTFPLLGFLRTIFTNECHGYEDVTASIRPETETTETTEVEKTTSTDPPVLTVLIYAAGGKRRLSYKNFYREHVERREDACPR